MPSKPSAILGISYGHGDSSAALIVNGTLVAAAEEERFTRVKHYALFPTRAIEYCLKEAGIEGKEIKRIAVARRPLNQWFRRIMLAWNHPHLLTQGRKQKSRDQSQGPDESVSTLLRKLNLQSARIKRVEHHLAHVMSARILTHEDNAALFSFDGLGDFVSAAMGRPQGTGIEILNRICFPHSLGFFYTAITQYLGFPHFGDEFKVMGLSSYGEPTCLAAMRQLVKEKPGFKFELNLEAFPILKHPMRFFIEGAQPKCEPIFHRNLLTQMLGVAPRKPSEPLTRAHWNVAKSAQVRFEEVANHLLRHLHATVPSDTLALAGGCAHNSVWVGKIPQHTPFKNIVVAPAAHDAGIAIGAAALLAKQRVELGVDHPALLGPAENASLTGPSDRTFSVKEHSFSGDAALIAWMANEIADGKIVGLMRGRMEFGPRALGNRSILADPRVHDMKDRLNARVKHREPFRPFAASVLVEYQDEWFERSFFAPTMEAVFEVKRTHKNRIPAVVHVDNSCRIQSVAKNQQPFYWALIEAFRQKTGVPMLINTSFNDSEPIVCSETDAWNCFRQSDLDHLVIGGRAYSKVRDQLQKTA